MAGSAVLLAAYNGERYIARQISSILDQSWQDYILYIHDDGSTDKTAEILAEHEENYPEKIRLLHFEPTGSACRNFFAMLEQVDADYYYFSDQDDFWLPDKLETTRKALLSLENGEAAVPVLAFSDLKVADADLNVTAESYLRQTGRDPQHRDLVSILRRNSAAGCTIGINRACRDAALGIGDVSTVFMHDWWLLLTAAACGRTAYIDRPLMLYRQHGANVVGASRNKLAWLKEKAGNVLAGRQLAESKKGITYKKNAVQALLGLPGVTDENRLLLEDLAGICHPSKRVRMQTFRKYRLLGGSLKNAWKILLV